MKSIMRLAGVRWFVAMVAFAMFGGCWFPWCEDDPDDSDFPADSVWRFEMHYENTRLEDFLPRGGCSHTGPLK
jgi:hypothetical protein